MSKHLYSYNTFEELQFYYKTVPYDAILKKKKAPFVAICPLFLSFSVYRSGLIGSNITVSSLLHFCCTCMFYSCASHKSCQGHINVFTELKKFIVLLVFQIHHVQSWCWSESCQLFFLHVSDVSVLFKCKWLSSHCDKSGGASTGDYTEWKNGQHTLTKSQTNI